MSQPSTTAVIFPLVTALVKAEVFLGAGRTWHPINTQQKRFLKNFFASCRTQGAQIPEIESIASPSFEQVNAFLRQRGFDIQVAPFGPDHFAVASVLDVLVTWLQPGTPTQVQDATGQSYPAARLASGVSFLQSTRHRHPIAAITTRSGDVVFMTKADTGPAGLELLTDIEHLMKRTRPQSGFNGLIFPMVDLRQHVDISWLKGMYTSNVRGQRIALEEALQQTSFKMNEQGARAQSAVVFASPMGFFRQPPDMVIDAPFLIWLVRKGLSKPLFAGFITQQDWKHPGTIESASDGQGDR